jgi:hypothetical protein
VRRRWRQPSHAARLPQMQRSVMVCACSASGRLALATLPQLLLYSARSQVALCPHACSALSCMLCALMHALCSHACSVLSCMLSALSGHPCCLFCCSACPRACSARPHACSAPLVAALLRSHETCWPFQRSGCVVGTEHRRSTHRARVSQWRGVCRTCRRAAGGHHGPRQRRGCSRAGAQEGRSLCGAHACAPRMRAAAGRRWRRGRQWRRRQRRVRARDAAACGRAGDCGNGRGSNPGQNGAFAHMHELDVSARVPFAGCRSVCMHAQI